METHGQQYNTTIYNINFELGHTTIRSWWLRPRTVQEPRGRGTSATGTHYHATIYNTNVF
jgi:hypothetical protein